jgi:Family of unknown function (DUF6868)
MDIQTLATFLMWCTFINGALLVLSAIIFMLTPNLVYRLQTNCFPIPQETFNVVFYSFLGFYKIIILTFNVAPLTALLIIG